MEARRCQFMRNGGATDAVTPSNAGRMVQTEPDFRLEMGCCRHETGEGCAEWSLWSNAKTGSLIRMADPESAVFWL
ncbi:MAG: hypothetical protein JW706_10170 [Opitutales bacterium]|nr:hypothetical protein [Opitutales bacterium]